MGWKERAFWLLLVVAAVVVMGPAWNYTLGLLPTQLAVALPAMTLARPTDPSGISALAAVLGVAVSSVTLVVISVSAFFGRRQLNAMRDSSEVEAMLRSLEYIHVPDLRDARWFIFDNTESICAAFHKAIRNEILEPAAKKWSPEKWSKTIGEVKGTLAIEIDNIVSPATIHTLNTGPSRRPTALVRFDKMEATLKALDDIAVLILEKDKPPYHPTATVLLRNELLRWDKIFDRYILFRQVSKRGTEPRTKRVYCTAFRTLVKKLKAEK